MPGRLDPGEVLSTAFRAYRRTFSSLLTISFIFAIPNGLLGTILQGQVPTIVGYPLRSAIYYAFVAIFTAVVLEVAIRRQERPRRASRGSLLSALGPVFGSVVIAGGLYGAGVAVGLALVIVPGLFLLTVWALCVPVVVVERRSATASLGRSQMLVRGNGWQVFAVIALLVVVEIAAQVAFAGLLFSALGLAGGVIGAIVAATLLQPLEGLARSIMYFELLRLDSPEADEEETAVSPEFVS